MTCLSLRADPQVAIRYQVSLQPVVDFTLSFPSMAMPPTECLVPRDDLAWYYRTYCGDRCDPNDPRVSPIFAKDLSGLPPALIIAAEYDTLRDEAQAYAQPTEERRGCDPLHLRRRDGARFFADARHCSGCAECSRGNRTRIELTERGHDEPGDHSRSGSARWPILRHRREICQCPVPSKIFIGHVGGAQHSESSRVRQAPRRCSVSMAARSAGTAADTACDRFSQ